MLQTSPISSQDRRRNLSVRDFRAARICFKSGKFILQVTEYDQAAKLANEAITEAGRHVFSPSLPLTSRLMITLEIEREIISGVSAYLLTSFPEQIYA
jgi:hypothetical protein